MRDRRKTDTKGMKGSTECWPTQHETRDTVHGRAMSDNTRSVSIGEIVVSDTSDDILVAYGLGSCVAVCLYDPVAGVGGMLHALLPTVPSSSISNEPRPQDRHAKFVDQGIPMLLETIHKAGARCSRLVVKLAGGANVLSASGLNGALNIGERNVQAAESVLQRSGLHIRATATGGQIGRTVKLRVTDGRVTVRSIGQKERPLD